MFRKIQGLVKDGEKTVLGRKGRWGGVQVIDDNAKDYAFSNVFDVAAKAKP